MNPIKNGGITNGRGADVQDAGLSALYNLSDDQIEYQVRDRLSFMRFLGLGLGDRVPLLVVCRQTTAGQRMPRRCGCIAMRWRRRARWRSCFASSIGIWRGRAISRGAVRYWTHRSCRCRATTTPVTRMREVMFDLLRVPYQKGELKNVKHDWKYTSVIF